MVNHVGNPAMYLPPLPVSADDGISAEPRKVADNEITPDRRHSLRQKVNTPAFASFDGVTGGDRKSTRLNSSHANISYAVFCLKKKKNKTTRRTHKLNKRNSKKYNKQLNTQQ